MIDQAFEARKDVSSEAVFAYAFHLHMNGIDVEIPHLVPPGSREPDKGDLFVIRRDGKRLVYDVKGPEYPFTGFDDWPFGNNFIVNNWERAQVFHPDLYVYVNPALTHYGCITGSAARENWQKKFIRNKLYPGMGDQYPVAMVHTNLITFLPLHVPQRR